MSSNQVSLYNIVQSPSVAQSLVWPSVLSASVKIHVRPTSMIRLRRRTGLDIIGAGLRPSIEAVPQQIFSQRAVSSVPAHRPSISSADIVYMGPNAMWQVLLDLFRSTRRVFSLHRMTPSTQDLSLGARWKLSPQKCIISSSIRFDMTSSHHTDCPLDVIWRSGRVWVHLRRENWR